MGVAAKLNRVSPTQNGRPSRTGAEKSCFVRREAVTNAPGNLFRAPETSLKAESGAEFGPLTFDLGPYLSAYVRNRSHPHACGHDDGAHARARVNDRGRNNPNGHGRSIHPRRFRIRRHPAASG